ncbi:GtrA family protein [Chryseobacterium sp. CCH4-E10]|uniref:GtrA family protein n=1 Tax=Chryseobacterium sp. CCH4-E10 TaxID=1768758 RepID=UPI000836A01F|nr:GtrA family protein [Chryseobacterium sp. CCH4-E10]
MGTFYKSQTVSLIATAIDFLMTILLKEFIGLPYMYAHIIGLMSGGFTQFTLNRRWAFKAGKKTNKMIFRFLLVWAFNFSLNTFFVWWLTDFFQWNFMISKVMTSSIMAVSLNFLLHKKYVFK